VAAAQTSDEFAISHSWLVEIENKEYVPSIHKLFTLSAVYGVSMNELLSAYMDLEAAAGLHLSMQLPATHTLLFDNCDNEKTPMLSARGKRDNSLDQTNVLSRMTEVWGDLPVSFLEHVNLRRCRYGFIGLSDYTMSPLIRPGSLVQIDDSQRAAKPAQYRSEYERPIYFIELRTGYVCSWCEIKDRRLISIPHPLSPCCTQEFAYPCEAEIVGRVTGVALRLLYDTASRVELNGQSSRSQVGAQ